MAVVICLMVTEEYKSYKSYLKWKCNKGHVWESKLINIATKNRWCPFCASNRKLSLNDAIELDGYSAEKGIAFEHQGLQHLCEKNYIKMFGSNEGFSDLKNRDLLKKEILKKKNIELIEIPSLFHKTKINNLSCFLSDNYSSIFMDKKFPCVNDVFSYVVRKV
jgi:hypothetical protein